MAKNIDVIKAFTNGGDSPKTENVRIKDDKLFNYNTVLAQRILKEGGGYTFKFNDTRYSRTTSKLQGYLRYEIAAKSNDYQVVEDVPFGAQNL